MSFKSLRIPLILIVLLVLAGASTYYFYSQYQKSQARIKVLENPQEAAKAQASQLTESVGKLITLPSDEQPTIATITDKEKLKDQAFFAKAENGDKVLIYTTARKAILYRPDTNKIIDVAPVNIGTSSAQVAGTQTGQTIKVALYNGTTTNGLTNTFEKDLKAKVDNIEVVAKENAKKNDYDKTLLVDVSGNLKNVADQLAKVINGEVVDLPEGEKKPDADILIIIGK